MKNYNNILTKEEIIGIIRREKKYLAEKYHVSEIGLFGSYVRGEQKKRSDIDILVEFSKTPDLFTYIEIINYLKKKCGKKVDLVTRIALRKEIKAQILGEVLYL